MRTEDVMGPGDDRRTAIFVGEDGRDVGKTFKLTEMFALDGEDWAARVAYVFVKSGLAIPEGSGWAGLASVGAQQITGSGIPEMRQLLKEMLDCVRFVPDPKGNPGHSQPLRREDVSEVITLVKIRVKLMELHLGFSIAELRAMLSSAMRTSQEGSGDTEDQAPPSAQSSQPA